MEWNISARIVTLNEICFSIIIFSAVQLKLKHWDRKKVSTNTHGDQDSKPGGWRWTKSATTFELNFKLDLVGEYEAASKLLIGYLGVRIDLKLSAKLQQRN